MTGDKMGDKEPTAEANSHTGAEENQQAQTATSKESHIKVREIEYYDDSCNSVYYFVCINGYYIFQANPNDEMPQWKLLNADSERWDAVHQRIYRNFRSDKINKEDLPPHLPPPPETIPPEALNPPPPPAPKLFLVEDYPELNQYLRQCDGCAMALYVVLQEDRYESLNGDGEFHYPKEIFFNLESATSYKVAKTGDYFYHIRPSLIWLDGDTIGCEVPIRRFDHINREEVLLMATAKIEQ